MKFISILRAFRSTYRRYPSKQSYSKQSQPGELRRLFVLFCTALLIESVALQLITTADGSEVAFNPDPAPEVNTTEAALAIGSVASATVQQNEQSTQPDPATKNNTSPRSLITHANAAAPTTPLSVPTLLFRSPLRSYMLTQYFSNYHTAIDMAAPTGSAVFATTEGVVANTGYLLPGGGLMVKVDHDGGYSSYYAHLSAITTQVGQSVNNATQIARVGSTGWATGPHLHFMIWKNQQALNPLNLLQ